MMKLRQLLTDTEKDKRHRQNLFNIHITVFGWLVEFSGGFVMVLGSLILGQERSSYITLSLQTLTIIIYFNILPCVFLINDFDVKTNIASSSYYIMILEAFNCHRSYSRNDDYDGDEDAVKNNEEHSRVSMEAHDDSEHDENNKRHREEHIVEYVDNISMVSI